MLMGKAGAWLACIALAGILANAGCGAHGARDAAVDPGADTGANSSVAAQPRTAPVANLGSLPSPWALFGGQGAASQPRGAKGASFTESDVAKVGADYDPQLPLQNTAVNGTALALQPSFTGHPGDVSGLALATYHFHATGYDRGPQLRIEWDIPPQDAGSIWLGLSHWDKDRWDWYQGSLSGITDLPFIDEYFNYFGDLLLIVARTGTDPSVHNGLRLGGPAPVAHLSADVTAGAIPLSVHLDASASDPVEGVITRYEWDTDGDGAYDADTGSEPGFDTQYTSNGTFHPKVRVTNSGQALAVAAVDIVAIGPWQRTWGRGLHDEFTGVAADVDGSIYAAGSFSRPLGPPNVDVVLTKWSPSGELLWAKSFDSGESEYATDMALNSAGQVVITGSQDFNGNRQVLVQKWTSGGQLLWSTRFGGAKVDEAKALVLDGTEMYVAGNTDSASFTTDVFLTKVLSPGTATWTTTRDFGDKDDMSSLAARYDVINGFDGVVMATDAKLGATYNIIKMEYTSAGAYEGGVQLGTTDQPKRHGQILSVTNLMTLQTVYYVGGTVNLGTGYWPFITKTDSAGVSLFGNAYQTAVAPQIFDMRFDSTGINLCGLIEGTNGENSALLLKFSADTGTVLGAETWATVAEPAQGFAVTRYRDGLLLAGRAVANNGGWNPLPAGSSAMDLSFSMYMGGGAIPNWPGQAADGLVADISADGLLNQGSGEDDALLLFRPEL